MASYRVLKVIRLFFSNVFFASTDCFVTNYTMPLRIANDELHVSCFCAKLVKFEVVAPRLV